MQISLQFEEYFDKEFQNSNFANFDIFFKISFYSKQAKIVDKPGRLPVGVVGLGVLLLFKETDALSEVDAVVTVVVTVLGPARLKLDPVCESEWFKLSWSFSSSASKSEGDLFRLFDLGGYDSRDWGYKELLGFGGIAPPLFSGCESENPNFSWACR